RRPARHTGPGAAKGGICHARSSRSQGAIPAPGRVTMNRRFRRASRTLAFELACLLPAAAIHAQGATRIDIPAGDLAGALDALARSSGTQLIYQADQLRGLRTAGVHGAMPPDEALDR